MSRLRSTVVFARFHHENHLAWVVPLLGLWGVCALDAVPLQAAQPPVEGFERLFDGTFSGWVCYSAEKNAKRDDTWKIQPAKNPDDAVLVCLGKPFGYLRTEQEFDNFELSLEWRYITDPNSNSGVLVYTSGRDAIWPRGIQVQLHRPEAEASFRKGAPSATTSCVPKILSSRSGNGTVAGSRAALAD